jgi:hypothetical protein
LTTDANHRGALATSLAAHRRLRSDSRNFWESAWLDRQIADLDERMRALP